MLTHSHERQPARELPQQPPWYQTLSDMLTPMGVHTFQATTGDQAVDLIEHHPIHLAVVDTRLAGNGGLAVLRIIQRIRQQTRHQVAPDATTENAPQHRGTQQNAPTLQVKIKDGPGSPNEPQPVSVKFNPPTQTANKNQVWPAVILLTPVQDCTVMQEALQCNAFSVVNEPVDLNLMLDTMARAMRRFHQNQWPM